MTLKVIVLAIVLSLVLAVSNAYLALKIGILTSASIPAAVISMGILRFFKNSTILENNLVQTAASAGEAVAGGIVYTIPALIIIHYWTGFNYWENFFIALLGGILGVMFSIPLRRILMTNKHLTFPEGKAIAEVLKVSNQKIVGISTVIWGALSGAVLEFCQTGIKIFADHAQYWVKIKNTLFGFGVGFSPAMIGAGYLIGFRLTASIFLGAIISWLIGIPIFSHLYPDVIHSSNASDAAHLLWGDNLRYVGIGAMLTAGVITLATLIKPFLASIVLSLQALRYKVKNPVLRTDFDIPLHYVLFGSLIGIIGLFFLYQYLFPTHLLELNSAWTHSIIYAAFFYTIIAGFIFSAITAYFSGMVGVSASPGSSIVIAGLLLAAALIFALLHASGYATFSPQQIQACEAITIICAAVITGMAAISNDNMQDLKVGYILGATPWKQQLMLLLGVVCASAIITPVMQLLYHVYGIAGVTPNANMDPALSLPAPPAAAMAMLSAAVFQQHIPWDMLGLGGLIVVMLCGVNFTFKKRSMSISILGTAIGMYLPLASSTPLFIGGLIAWLVNRNKPGSQANTMLACGLIAGAALLDVLLAIPFSLMQNPNAFNLAPSFWGPVGVVLSVGAVLGLVRWFKKAD